MRIVLIVLISLGAAVYVASWFWAGDEVEAAAAKPWVHGLGTVATVSARYPPQHENEGARKLTTLAGGFAEDEAITRYVRQEVARDALAIAEPPAIADLSAIRDLLLREPVVWKRDLEQQHGGLLPKVTMFQSLTRALIANALGRARRNEPAAWDDLRAAWNLTKSLDGHPHRIVRVVAISMTRAINGVAWKMPLPVPAWFDEVQQRDFVRPMFETLQYENWRAWRHQRFVPIKSLAAAIDGQRVLTSDLASVTECDFHAAPASQRTPADAYRLDIIWRRAFRYRVEREATANALRARAGQTIEEGSRCNDGRWSLDGKTLRFTRPIALPERLDTSMPLTLHIRE